MDIVKESLLRYPGELSSSDVIISSSLASILDMMQVMLLALMLLLAYNWFNVDKDLTGFFMWDPGGGFSVLSDCMTKRNLGEGGL